MSTRIVGIIGLACMIVVLAATAAGQNLQVFTSQQTLRVATSGGAAVLEIQPVVWGPEWAWTGVGGSFSPADGGAHGAFKGRMGGTQVPFTLDISLKPTGARTLEITAQLATESETALTMAVLAVSAGEALRGPGRVSIIDSTGQRQMNAPMALGELSPALEAMEMQDGHGRVYALRLDPAMPAAADGAARIVLAAERLTEPRRVSITLELPADANFMLSADAVAMPENWDQWFRWQATGTGDDNDVISLAPWLDAPAGRHGRITRDGDHLLYNGERIRLWGINASYSACTPPRDRADRQSAFYARYGINSVRLHKYADGRGWAGILRNGAADFDPEALDRMDYYVAQLKNRGIYTKLSANFGSLPLGPEDLKTLSFASEIRPGNDGWGRAMQGMLWFSREMQDLQMAQLLKVLEHTNPHTGMRYANDPAVACVEMVNENSVFFYTTLASLQQSPATKRLAGEAFFAWLKSKYPTQDALLKAWGQNMIGTFAGEQLADESWEKGLIYPVGNPWFFDPDQLEGSQASRKQRLLDTMQFMHEQQNAFYDRFYKALRDTGYRGEVITSNWQAGRAYSHYLNLHSDARIGMVDRHNYFDGAGTMVSAPGAGSLSAGMQQVAGLPFMLSEWIHVFPNEYGVEGPAIIGAYGMGLNGWDVSYMFQNGDEGRFRNELREPWDVVAPQILGIFPAVARQIYRDDVKEADLVFERKVHVPSLAEGRLGFEDRVVQDYDVKEFGSDAVPASTLAIGRSVVRYTDAFQPTDTVDISDYIEDDMIRSATSQLAWKPGEGARDGFFTIDTPGTQAVVGFASQQSHELADVTLSPRTEFAAIYVSAAGPDGAIASGDRLLITTLARVRNTGMKFVGATLVDRGRDPMLVEPVTVDIQFQRSGEPTIHVLDHDGRRTGRTVPVENRKATLDGAQTQTVYYEVTFQ
jgi:hypothetical protein